MIDVSFFVLIAIFFLIFSHSLSGLFYRDDNSVLYIWPCFGHQQRTNIKKERNKKNMKKKRIIIIWKFANKAHNVLSLSPPYVYLFNRQFLFLFDSLIFTFLLIPSFFSLFSCCLFVDGWKRVRMKIEISFNAIHCRSFYEFNDFAWPLQNIPIRTKKF